MTIAEDERVLEDIKDFYNRFPFPGYEVDEYYTIGGLYERASPYVRAIDEEMPLGARILDIGCGTGQFAALLSARGRDVIGVDLSPNSIKKANRLKERLGLTCVTFLERDLFELDLPREAYDFVFCNGVLHHTADPYRGFQVMVSHAKPGGYVIVGLYNTYGRLPLKVRGVLFRLVNARLDSMLTRLDYFLRSRGLSDTQKRVWFEDQYHNPHETVHTVGKVLDWFGKSEVDFVSGIPNPRLYGTENAGGYFGPPSRSPSQLEAFLAQLGWIVTTQREGGYFLTIGRKRGSDLHHGAS